MSDPRRVDALITSLRRAADRAPDRAALMTGGAPLSYGVLCDQVERLARAMIEDGVRPGDRVALLIDRTPDHVVAYAATLAAGAVAVPVDPDAPLPVVTRVFQDARPAAAIVEDDLAEVMSGLADHNPDLRLVYVTRAGTSRAGTPAIHGLRERLACAAPPGPHAAPAGDSLAAIVYTSGTTGTPKGVMLSHRNLCEIAAAGQWLFGVTDQDRIGVVSPLSHLYGLREIDLAFASGAALVLPPDVHFPARALALFGSAGVTGLSAVPSWLTLILQRYRGELAACAGALRYLAIGTAPISGPLLETLRALLPRTRLVVTYGLTEASRVCWRDVTDPATPVDPGIVGQPYPGVDLELLDEAAGVGHVALRSGMVMTGYWNRPEATRTVITEDGRLLTPDCGRLDPDGTLHLLGRVDDVINCGGRKVSPVEIEDVLSGHPAVTAVAALAAPDPDGVLGHVVQVVIVRQPGNSLSAADVRQWAAARLESYKVPRFVEFVDRIPSSVLGKSQRALLRHALGRGPDVQTS